MLRLRIIAKTSGKITKFIAFTISINGYTAAKRPARVLPDQIASDKPSQ